MVKFGLGTYRRFAGKRYELITRTRTRSEAIDEAQFQKGMERKARVVEGNRAFGVYTRRH